MVYYFSIFIGVFVAAVKCFLYLLVVPLVSLDNPLHQMVTHDIFLAELNLPYAIHAVENAKGLHKVLCGRSIWVTSPVIIILAFMPRRVRNILI